MTQRTYLDWNATAPLRPEARAAMIEALDRYGNASSIHTEGRQARALIERAREQVAELVGAAPADIVFTSGATEANATVMAAGWDSLAVSAVEHDSVLAAARQCGAALTVLPVNREGWVDATVLPVLPGRALLSVQSANGETGILQPLTDLVQAARRIGAAVHCDATQSVGRMPFSCAALDIDYVSMSSHKIGGPQGVGALIVRGHGALKPWLVGGGQERRRRAGTENVAGIAGFGAAAEAARHALQAWQHVGNLQTEFEKRVVGRLQDSVIIGHSSKRLPNTTCIAGAGRSAEIVVMQMDLAGIAVSAGSACSSGKVGASHVLKAMGIDEKLARSAIRVSLGWSTTAADMERFVACWAACNSVGATVENDGAGSSSSTGWDAGTRQEVQHARSA